MAASVSHPRAAIWAEVAGVWGTMDLDAFVQWWQDNALAMGVGLGVALLILGFYAWRRRPSATERLASAAEAAAASQKMDAATEEAALEWAPRQLALAERRASIRRGGAVVRVTVASPLFHRGVTDGFVLDRSTGGLCIALATEVPRGVVLKVRAAHAPDTVGYINVIVRNCRRQEEYYEVGCEFEQTPPWNVLLLFG
ncbi:MAG: PilZ domain-containing protein [Thermogemmata sp.]|uniref:PilZ domain-containing protein n=1 Tax=Thermogemmata fonticola TaxID=2755323 RepID=A0A7V8VFY9_9BACT|nr:PilZ domain-containing protein [Thermogemmata fonticola]MBA2227200.1 PilZ domain-containing protein [Thermogemmata fonticola]MCX8140487.1 PilZ domain-containing protein [Gemmataceae bacterium]